MVILGRTALRCRERDVTCQDEEVEKPPNTNEKIELKRSENCGNMWDGKYLHFVMVLCYSTLFFCLFIFMGVFSSGFTVKRPFMFPFQQVRTGLLAIQKVFIAFSDN